MDHNESVRKFEHLMLKQADHAREAAIELEALVATSKGKPQTSQGVSRTRAESPRKLEAEAVWTMSYAPRLHHGNLRREPLIPPRVTAKLALGA